MCITTTEKYVVERTFKVNTGEIICVKGLKTDARARIVGESKSDYFLYVLKVEIENFINDCKNKVVKVNQLFKDKETLIHVTAKYVIYHNFNFKEKLLTKRSRLSYICYITFAAMYKRKCDAL